MKKVCITSGPGLRYAKKSGLTLLLQRLANFMSSVDLNETRMEIVSADVREGQT